MRFILIIISFVNILLYYSAYAYYDTILGALAKYELPVALLSFIKYFIIFILGFLIGFLIILGMFTLILAIPLLSVGSQRKVVSTICPKSVTFNSAICLPKSFPKLGCGMNSMKGCFKRHVR